MVYLTIFWFTLKMVSAVRFLQNIRETNLETLRLFLLTLRDKKRSKEHVFENTSFSSYTHRKLIEISYSAQQNNKY